jgi:hypothetical protein
MNCFSIGKTPWTDSIDLVDHYETAFHGSIKDQRRRATRDSLEQRLPGAAGLGFTVPLKRNREGKGTVLTMGVGGGASAEMDGWRLSVAVGGGSQ